MGRPGLIHQVRNLGLRLVTHVSSGGAVERWRHTSSTRAHTTSTELPCIRVKNSLALNRPLNDTLWSLANRVFTDLYTRLNRPLIFSPMPNSHGDSGFRVPTSARVADGAQAQARPRQTALYQPHNRHILLRRSRTTHCSHLAASLLIRHFRLCRRHWRNAAGRLASSRTCGEATIRSRRTGRT